MESILKTKRLEKNMTLEEVGNLVGVGKSTVRKWENGMIENMGRDKIVALSKALNISPLEILGMDENPTLESDISTIYNQLDQKRQAKVYNFADRQLREQKYGVADAGKIVPLKPRKKIPVDIYGRLSAGGGAYNDKSVIETAEVDSAPPKYDMAFVVSGDSMYPTFEDGEVVFVNETQDVFNGQIAAIEINNEAFIKKIYLEDKRMRMVSLNVDTDKNGKRLYPDFYADECDNLFVIGRVIM
ncbi:XRE family transcriptional regulator [Enterococcus dongliensis]|uniref:S24 family peptidase n=1 Tax=Enterococcus dongliensis TaxID=2559925 RepID=A0ABU3EST9_9ENTE|nr:S24 family peptidase [Enterococcus dongliensis]MDT2597393.1 S24 family peptidase [Enterococcus dongliensis]